MKKRPEKKKTAENTIVKEKNNRLQRAEIHKII